MTIMSLIGIAITLIFFVAFFPTLDQLITGVTGVVDDTTLMVLRFLPLAIAISILLLPFWYAAPKYVSGGKR